MKVYSRKKLEKTFHTKTYGKAFPRKVGKNFFFLRFIPSQCILCILKKYYYLLMFHPYKKLYYTYEHFTQQKIDL